jgi:hypothetical protein
MMTYRRVIFDLPIGIKGTWVKGRFVRPWRTYEFRTNFLEDCQINFVEIENDETRIGTALSKRFAQFGLRVPGCSCNSAAAKLDKLDQSWIRKHKRQIIELIEVNVRIKKKTREPFFALVWREISIRIIDWLSDHHVRLLLRICLHWAIFDERRRLRGKKDGLQVRRRRALPLARQDSQRERMGSLP